MLLTSAAIPPVATLARLRGMRRARKLAADPAGAPVPAAPRAVLLDRDGTLVRDVPYNGDPALVDPLPGVREALERLRAHGIRLAVVSNQSGIARGRLTAAQAEAVMARADELLGPFDDVRWCPHGPEEGCACRKPAPGLLLAAAAALEVDPSRCAMIGDIGADVDAARAAGMRGVLVPTDVTRPEEVAAAPEAAPTFAAAVDLLLRVA
jgi:HAD superfamily hydrolase (TIGR01662 family)